MDYQKLFNHMYDEYGLLLLEAEMQEIIKISKELKNQKTNETTTLLHNG